MVIIINAHKRGWDDNGDKTQWNINPINKNTYVKSLTNDNIQPRKTYKTVRRCHTGGNVGIIKKKKKKGEGVKEEKKAKSS